MIGKIKGILFSVDDNTVLIDTPCGVSYELYVTPDIISNTPIGGEIEVYTYLQVRDDAFKLFGFKSKDYIHFFKMLLGVSGVGPKTAFLIVSNVNINELMQAVKENNLDYFTSIPGLGKKTAMKIMLELSQKIKSEFKIGQFSLSEEDKTVIDALVALGYKSQEAKSLFSRIPRDMSIENKIKYALNLTVQ